MNATERLKAIIQERLAQRPVFWAPILVAWGLVLVVRTTVELWTGPRADLGALAALVAVGFQVFSPWGLVTREGRKEGVNQGLWVLLAVTGWVLGSLAPGAVWLSPTAGAVLELVFLAGGLVQTAIRAQRRLLEVGAAGLLAAGVLLALVPDLLPYRPLALTLGLLVPAVVTLLKDRRA